MLRPLVLALLPLLLAPAGARASVVIISPPLPSLDLLVIDGSDVRRAVDGDLVIRLPAAGLTADSLSLDAGGSITVAGAVELIADGSIDFCAGSTITLGAGSFSAASIVLDAPASCDIGTLLYRHEEILFQGPTAGVVALSATGDIRVVPEPAGALLAGLGGLGWTASALRARWRPTSGRGAVRVDLRRGRAGGR
jgi:hypothetical protein